MRLCVGVNFEGIGPTAQDNEYSRRILWCLDREFEYVEADCSEQGQQQGHDERDKEGFARIIEARMSEIIEQVHYEIRNSGFENKLIAGIVLTGGGSQLRHIAQLFEFITGMETRIGYPTEHLASGTDPV